MVTVQRDRESRYHFVEQSQLKKNKTLKKRLKCLLCKQEGLGLDPQNPYRKLKRHCKPVIQSGDKRIQELDGQSV